ncbi:protein fem-1 homolog B-like isoform X2 [Oratosquilla oratoria]|uniref:protein fem-1 homolog B-like isoform X2 n=1 Tax=Oratosquilla oratoria TaxID=337810 RepID=UPI003F766641
MSGKQDQMKIKVFHASKEGMSLSLYALLSVESEEKCRDLLSQVVEEDGQKCTPLLIAARNGHEKAVRTILKFSPDLEQEATVKFDGYVIEGASPLWCASGAGHLGVVKMLVRAGANVNHPTRTNSTPLRAACFDGRLDIVKYLTEHEADIHIANKYNNTCLMIAAYKGHLDVVQYLLELGARPDERAHCGATALQFAAECGHVKIVEELLKHNAKITKNEHGMTPLIAAAERTRADVVEFFISRSDITREEKIDALELLGASFASDKDNYDIELAYKYLSLGMKERFSQADIIAKPKVPPISAYDYHVECQTVEELEAIRHVSASLHMESLAIRERILGPHNPEVFSQMLHVGVELEFLPVHEVLEATVLELERDKEKIHSPGPKDDVDTIKDELESNMVTGLYLIMIAVRVAKGRMANSSSNKIVPTEQTRHTIGDNEAKVHQTVYKLVRSNATTRAGHSLLHLAVNPDTPVDDFHTNHVCKFPCATTAKLLITCGASVNAMDANRNTPLHLIVSYQKPISDFLTLHSIIMALIEGGAHMDTVNQMGATPFDSATTGVAEIILRTQKKLNLKCLAAKVVKIHGIPYKGQVPTHLEAFIELHGPGHVDGLGQRSKNPEQQHL